MATTLSYSSPYEFFNDIENFALIAQSRDTSLDSPEVLNLIGPAMSGFIQLGTATQYYDSLAEFLLSFNVSYTMDGASQITLEFFDPEYRMAEANFFQIRQELKYRGATFEIAALEFGPGSGGAPSVKVEARNAAVQKMKRAKDTTSVSGSTGYEYANNAAAKYGLRFLGENSATQKNVVHPSSADKDASVWTVLQSVAGDSQYVCFEVDGTLVFASQKYLLWKLGLQSRIANRTIKENASGKEVTTTRGSVQKYCKLFFYNDLSSGIGTVEFSDKTLEIATYPTNPKPLKSGTADIPTYVALCKKKYPKIQGSELFYITTDAATAVIIPSISSAGIKLDLKQALSEYKKTTTHFGKFNAEGPLSGLERARQYSKELRIKFRDLLALGSDFYTNIPAFELVTYPSFRRSDNDPLEGDGGALVRKPNGQLLRPGYTALVGPKPTSMRGGYLITEVSFSELNSDPVQVTYRTPVKPVNQNTPE